MSSAQLFIPRIGSLIALTEDWSFNLYLERRNKTLLRAIANSEDVPDVEWGSINSLERAEKYQPYYDNLIRIEDELTDQEKADASKSVAKKSRVVFVECTLPKDTVLSFSRIYIRQGVDAYDSVTFRTANCPDKKLKGKRFWVSLNDANKISYLLVAR